MSKINISCWQQRVRKLIHPCMRMPLMPCCWLADCYSLLPPAELSADRRTLLPLPISQSIKTLKCTWEAASLGQWGEFAWLCRSRRSNSKCCADHQSRHFLECVAFYTAAWRSVGALSSDGRGQRCYSSEMSTEVAPEGRRDVEDCLRKWRSKVEVQHLWFSKDQEMLQWSVNDK